MTDSPPAHPGPQPDVDVKVTLEATDVPDVVRTLPALYDGQPREDRIKQLGHWLSMPEGQRPQRTVAEWARAEGCPRAANDLYGLMRHPSVLRIALGATAAGIAERLPRVLDALATAAEAGSVHAAVALLRHVRELATLAGESVERMALHKHLADANDRAGDLVRLATSLANARPTATASVASSAADRWASRARAAVPRLPPPPPTPHVPAASPPPPPGGPSHQPTGLRGQRSATATDGDTAVVVERLEVALEGGENRPLEHEGHEGDVEGLLEVDL